MLEIIKTTSKTTSRTSSNLVRDHFMDKKREKERKREFHLLLGNVHFTIFFSSYFPPSYLPVIIIYQPLIPRPLSFFVITQSVTAVQVHLHTYSLHLFHFI